MANNTERRKIRWVIAHHPVELFLRTANAFVQELEELCPGQFDVEILTFGTYADKYGHLYTPEEIAQWKQVTPSIEGLESHARNIHRTDITETATFADIKDKWEVFFNGLKDGKYEITQNQVSIVGGWLDSNFHAIDLPFLFSGHDHVSKVLDGEIGDKLCDSLSDKTGIRGLAFTYSGGYRIIGSTEGITSLYDLNAKKFITGTASSYLLFDELGISHITKGSAAIDDIGDIAKQGGAIETTYLRFDGKNVLKTNHSMFMTTVMTSDSFLATLTEEQRQAFKTAAKSVAKKERLWSVEDAAKYEVDAESRGVTIVDLPEEERAKMRKSASMVYRNSNLKRIGVDPELVQDILKIGYEMDKSHYLQK